MLLPGDFIEKKGLQNTSPSMREPPNALQNGSLWNPKWLPTTKYKTKISTNHQIRAVYKIYSKKVAPSRRRKCPKQTVWDMLNPAFCRETIRNPCCGLRTPVISPPRLFLWHVLACPSTSMKTFRPWDCHYLAAVADEFPKMCMVLIIVPIYFLIFQLLVWCSCSAPTCPDGFQNENAFRL